MTDFVGEARPIIAYDVAAMANCYKVELASLRAVMAVESRNSGYDWKRRPIILFEPHVFYRNLSGAQRDRAEQLGLAYVRWGMQPYPKTQDGQYKRLAAAIQINEEAAYRSISMGMGQVLGENFHACGCNSAKDMFELCMESESLQLKCMLEFIKFNALIPYLNNHDWGRFAEHYNGKGQVPKYAAWLAREYTKWARIVAKPRKELDAQDLKDAGSKTVEYADTGKKAVKAAAVVGPSAGVILDAATEGLKPVTQAVQTAQQTKDAWDWIHDNWEFLAVVGMTALFLVLCYFAYKAFHQVIEERVQNARDGMNMRI
jgi:N-acetylmuramidase